ncbi:SMP-30/gluconolactonase/LRE family protein [Novosphingobium aerophilum]|uniref:SMP-30/gluconolactonase/LRE family protein n=1 Tax=Novosphingobium aerophilum TaxID=2839843 RepID=A0A7X1F4Z8_9SPHN|nr:SMP-30/gluconolactonase/LRE family protein [Novosphingobium aerophilum]MBC2650460.1 SMP-30/gluconolactonase/LRE family protein [Novosphingobium aerophilum]
MIARSALTATAERVLAAGCTLGEGPVWDQARACLWFTDIKQHKVHRFDPAGGQHRSYALPGQVGWVVPLDDGGVLAGLPDGLHRLDPMTGVSTHLLAVPGEPDGNRLNDACVDSGGAVHFGSMDDAETGSSGRFYRAHGGTIVPAGPAGICITNGPAVSPDGRRIYYTDTLARTIAVAELDATGRPGPARLFVDVATDFPDAYPDGPVCDAAGCLWTGLWNGWAVARYSPEGRLLETVALPVANVTKLAFGGPDLSRAYVTTARKGLDAAALAAQPMAGDLFAFSVAVPGVAQPAARFAV